MKLAVIIRSSLESPKLVSQRCPNWPVLKSCFCVQGDRTVKHAQGSVGLYYVSHGQFSVCDRQTDPGVACGQAQETVSSSESEQLYGLLVAIEKMDEGGGRGGVSSCL